MVSEQISNTDHKLKRRVPSTAFKPGFDPRRNLKGRPRSFDQVRSLAQKLAHERRNGFIAVEDVLRSWRDSRDPSLQKAFIEYAFGKVPDKLETTGLENKTSITLYFDHERGLTEGNGR